MDNSPVSLTAKQLAPKPAYRHPLPTVSPLLRHWFLRYAEHYVRRNMHGLRVAGEHYANSVAGRPVLVYMNHPGWWDPMIAAVLARRYFSAGSHYAPIDATALDKYKFFSRIGFFGVEPGNIASIRKLVEVGEQVLSQHNGMLWLTPQARFADVRERPLRIGSAVAHLIERVPSSVTLPVALEYAFWEERYPEALVRFGAPLEARDLLQVGNLPAFLELRLEENMAALAHLSVTRSAAAFTTMLSGKAGVGGVYDGWRRLRAKVRGEQFRTQHGAGQ